MTPCTRILVHELRVTTIIGIYDFERTDEEELIIDFAVTLSDNQAGQSDNIADAYNYTDAIRQIKFIAQHNEFQLIETFAEHAVAALLDHPLATAVHFTLKKPGGSKIAASTGVELYREKSTTLSN